MSIADAYNFIQVSEQLSTSGAVSSEQIESLSEQGYSGLINLLPDESEYALKGERQLVEQQSLVYWHIPVDFKAPLDSDYAAFAAVMDQTRGQQIHIHCAANWRVSAFYAIYQYQRSNWTAAKASEFIAGIWSPEEHPAWQAFITRHLDAGS